MGAWVHEDDVLTAAGQLPRENCAAAWAPLQIEAMQLWMEEHGYPDSVMRVEAGADDATSISSDG